MTDRPSIIEFVTDPQCLGLAISPAQETLLRALYGLPLDEEQLGLWRACTARETYRGEPFGEATVIAGARSGKDSRILVPTLLYEAVFGNHEKHLGKGEVGVIPLVAQDQRATKIAYGYVRDYATGSPLLSRLVEEVREQEIWLTNRVRLMAFACTAKSLRGWSVPAAGMDEVAFFRLEGDATEDVEVQTAIKRGGVGFPETKLVKISTPYMKSGLLYDDFARYYGQDSPDVLVWQAATTTMNPTIGEGRLARERRADARRASREFDALFADDTEAFLPSAWLEAAVVEGRHELAPAAVA